MLMPSLGLDCLRCHWGVFTRRGLKTFVSLLCVPATVALADSPAEDDKPKRYVEGIMDNSFLVEEAYNQEKGVVQHIFTAIYVRNRRAGPDDESWLLTFTQEWPVFSQTHQFSYTIPYSSLRSGGVSADGLGDILLNYRYQAYLNPHTLTAFAPRASLVLPTSDRDSLLGENTLGPQFNLPFSTTFGDRWFAHFNAGVTYLPGPLPRSTATWCTTTSGRVRSML